MPSAEIITIGTEILLGEIVDTNTRFLARALRGLGVDLYRTLTIGDNAQRIAEVIQDSMRRADIVITTGGLGPTVDDPTREAVARAVGVEVEFREELWEQVKAVVSRYGRVAGENQKRQAMVPQGAIAIPNPVGTAPSFVVEFNRDDREEKEKIGGKHTGAIISLPGVPQEMEYLFHHAVIPYLQKNFNLSSVIKVRLLHTSGMSEANVDDHVGEFELLSNPTVGLAAHSGVVDIRIAAKAESEEEADRLIEEVETQIRARLGTVIFGADDETLPRVTLAACAAHGWNAAALESGLDGWLTRALSADTHPNLLAVEAQTFPAEELAARTRELRERVSARVGLGVALTRGASEQVIELFMVTPEGETSRRLTYGGPPNYSPRWAGNAALNWMRLQMSEKK